MLKITIHNVHRKPFLFLQRFLRCSWLMWFCHSPLWTNETRHKTNLEMDFLVRQLCKVAPTIRAFSGMCMHESSKLCFVVFIYLSSPLSLILRCLFKNSQNINIHHEQLRQQRYLKPTDQEFSCLKLEGRRTQMFQWCYAHKWERLLSTCSNFRFASLHLKLLLNDIIVVVVLSSFGPEVVPDAVVQ